MPIIIFWHHVPKRGIRRLHDVVAELSFDTCKVQSRKMQVEQKHYLCTPIIPYFQHFIISDTNLTKIPSEDTYLVQPWTLAHASWSPTPVAYPKGIGTGMFGKGWMQYFEQEVWLDAIMPDTDLWARLNIIRQKEAHVNWDGECGWEHPLLQTTKPFTSIEI